MLTRWQPLRELAPLRDTVNRLFDDTFFQPIPLLNGIKTVPVDLIEREDELVVRAAAPGFSPEQIDVSIQGDVLTLQGTSEEEHEDNNTNYYLREHWSGSFHRVIRLPVEVDADQARAEYSNGMLTLHLPKVERSNSRKIEVMQPEVAP